MRTLRSNPLTSQLVRFGAIGVASTLLNLVLFAAFVQVMSHQWANGLALVICTVLNTAANRRYTFGAGSHTAWSVQVRSLALLAITWGTTAAALWLLHQASPGAGTAIATITVAVGNVVATIIRFVLLRRWFAEADPAHPVQKAEPPALQHIG